MECERRAPRGVQRGEVQLQMAVAEVDAGAPVALRPKLTHGSLVDIKAQTDIVVHEQFAPIINLTEELNRISKQNLSSST